MAVWVPLSSIASSSQKEYQGKAQRIEPKENATRFAHVPRELIDARLENLQIASGGPWAVGDIAPYSLRMLGSWLKHVITGN
jgi:hypothetical protein